MDSKESSKPLLEEDEMKLKTTHWSDLRNNKRRLLAYFAQRKFEIGLLITLLALSNASTWIVSTRQLSPIRESLFPMTSLIANLRANTVQSYSMTERRFNYQGNDTASYHTWKSIRTDNALIAVPDSISEPWGLNPPMRFPWDASKGLFEIAGLHTMHCLRTVAMALYQLRNDEPLSRPWAHVNHCLARIASDIECYADDTPYPVAPDGVHYGKTRKCRSWDGLNHWAEGRNACFATANGSSSDLIDHLKFCPPGSPYEDQIARIWGKEWIEALKQPMPEYDWIPQQPERNA